MAERAESAKFSRIGSEANDHNIDFISLANESFGILSELSLETFQQIVSRLKQFHSTKSYPHLFYFMQIKMAAKTECKHHASKYFTYNNSHDTPYLPNSSYSNSNW